jgi:hypothetical protein
MPFHLPDFLRCHHKSATRDDSDHDSKQEKKKKKNKKPGTGELEDPSTHGDDFYHDDPHAHEYLRGQQLEELTERLRGALQFQYSVGYHEEHTVLGCGWLATPLSEREAKAEDAAAAHATDSTAPEDSRSSKPSGGETVMIKLMRAREETPTAAAALDAMKHAVSCHHPFMVRARDVFVIDGVGPVFVFDVPSGGAKSLEKYRECVGDEVSEELVLSLFVPVVMGLFHLENKGLLPMRSGIVTPASVVRLPNGLVQMINPYLAMSGEARNMLLPEGGDGAVAHPELDDDDDEEQNDQSKKRHRLTRKLHKGSRKTAEGDQRNGSGEAKDGGPIADLARLLYFLVFGPATDSGVYNQLHYSHTQADDAEPEPFSAMLKRTQQSARVSQDLRALLVSLLIAGSDGSVVLTLPELLRKPIMHKGLDQLVNFIRTNSSLDDEARETYLRCIETDRALVSQDDQFRATGIKGAKDVFAKKLPPKASSRPAQAAAGPALNDDAARNPEQRKSPFEERSGDKAPVYPSESVAQRAADSSLMPLHRDDTIRFKTPSSSTPQPDAESGASFGQTSDYNVNLTEPARCALTAEEQRRAEAAKVEGQMKG